ncbi:P-II family nitrogen regulator [Brucepastera parasyntrophica]|uniref:P-II family nitrogen regulator n=1 Tax=Brucepastera parasyntrophica TaxID=2880008 RepID=UPI002108622F|nr:P-II family nitrogen regulator [Brucepastera parasyntrophica]ULQ60572.1 P-II family nitrogen regulator [Brucepastera parasyntrophica]
MEYTKLIFTIVNHGLGEKVAEEARKAGARGGTILVGRSSIDSKVLRALMMADIEKDILLTLVNDNECETIFKAICDAPLFEKKNQGVAFVTQTGGELMNTEATQEMISVIVNRGYADDVMEAARKAGAQGGTIINARGTGKPGDEKFFGVTIVPEKEQVLILAENDKAQAIRDAISSLKCLSTPGIGIMFSVPAGRYTQLGHKKEKK